MRHGSHLNNDSWETDEDYLKLVLADYANQVLEYQSEHPVALDSKMIGNLYVSGV